MINMFEKDRLLKNVENLLIKSDFNYTSYHGCFDIAAKKEKLLLIKVLFNVDSFQESQAENLKALSNVLDGNPIIIGEQTRAAKLEEGVVYHRFSIPAMNLRTFQNLITKNDAPIVYSERGGFFVEIDSDILKKLREKKFTQEELAEKVGVTKKNIYEHESKDMKAVSSVAQKIQSILGEKISKPFQLVKFDSVTKKPTKDIQKDVFNKMKKIGFDVSYIGQSPLNVAAKEKVLLLSDVERDKRKMKKDAPALRGLSKLISSPAVLITDRSKTSEIEGVPVVEAEELRGLKRTKDVIRIIKEKKQ